MLTDQKIEEVAGILWAGIYEAEFRGKGRGRYCLTREQLKQALGVDRLHATTIGRLQDAALAVGLVIVDLDDLFPCVEVDVVRRYRRPSTDVFEGFFPPNVADGRAEADDDAE